MRTRFLGVPTRGGWLTITNCAFWAAEFIWPQTIFSNAFNFLPPFFSLTPLIVFGTPLVLPYLWPDPGINPTLQDLITFSLLIGLNSIIWGYGLSFIVGKLLGERREQTTRGFPVTLHNDDNATSK